MESMIWHSPTAFWLIFLLVAVLITFYWQRSKKTPSLLYSSVALLKEIKPSLRAKLGFLPRVLKSLALILMIVALARPQKTDTKVQRNIEGIDILIVMDISDSMLIEDMKPFNRFEAAKETLQKFVKMRSNDRIGVVIFSGEAFTLVPLTLDYELILSRVEELTTAQEARIKQGTAIGVALAAGAGHLKDSTAKSRVMIFMTDGGNNAGTIDPDTGLSIAKGYGLKIYTVGLGTDGPKRIPIYQRDVFGNRVKTYQPFEDEVNDELLGRVARETGGKYFKANREDSLSGVFAEIDKLEKTKIDVNKFTRYSELFPIWLLAALLLYGLAWVLEMTWLRRAP